MEAYGRILTAERVKQGFKTQNQLSAFFRHYDHQKQCAECQKPGPGAMLDDGVQPTMNSCPVADKLYADYISIAYA